MPNLIQTLKPSLRRTALLFRIAAVCTFYLLLCSVSANAANVAPLAATVDCSSERPATSQLCSKAVDGVPTGNPIDYTKEWATQGEKAGAWIQLNWSAPETVNRVVLNDRPNTNDQVLAGVLSFSDGSTVAVGALANNGANVTITFTQRTITSLRFTITSVASTTVNIGLAEISAFEPTLTGNAPPIATNSSIAVIGNGIYHGNLKATDADGNVLTYRIVTPAARGTTTIDNAQAGAFTYMPSVGSAGPDSFTFKANDGVIDSNIAKVSATIDPLAVTDLPPIMVIAAHPDDESIMAAGILKTARDKGEPIKVVLVTNGDYNGATAGVTRQNEAITALVTRLGLREDDVIFLGYPDFGLSRIYNNYPTVASGAYLSRAGKSQTYAQRGLGRADFHTYDAGAAANYNRANLAADLTRIVARYHPARIYSHSPVDEHPDHRMVSYALRNALRTVLASDAAYFPEVFSAVVHSPSTYPNKDFWPASDFSSLPPLSAPQDSFWPLPAYNGVNGAARFTPTVDLTEPLNLTLTPWQWSARLEFPVPAIMQTTNLANNLKYQMLTAHASQTGGIGLIYAFGKRTEVFWRTLASTNLAPRAQVTASSENSASFQTADRLTDGTIDGSPRNSQAEWKTQGQTVGAWARFTWSAKQPIETVVLYDRLALGQQITKGELRFDDGSKISFGPLPDDGSAFVVPVGFKSSKYVEVAVTEVSGTTTDAGLAELEILAPAAALPSNRAPYFTFGPMAGRYRLASGDVTNLQTQVGDLDGGALTVRWTSQLRGYLGAGTAIDYTAPVVNVTTKDTITVAVSDGINSAVSATFVMSINPVAPINLSAHRPVTTSSLEVSRFVGANAVDGNLATRWSSAYADPQWIYVDLGATYNVNRVVLKWETAYALQYRIEVSNDATNWMPVYTESAGNGATDDISFASAAGRYVRMYSTKRGTQYGNSLWEFEVYGTPAAPVVPTPNLAVNKPVKTSSLEVSQFGGANAVDGNLATRWSSAYADPQWIYVDLGATYNVNHVVLKWETAYALQYRIEVSNDATNWTPVYTESAGNGAIDDISFVSTATRYVRMYSTKRGTRYGNSLWEFEVYGTPAVPTPNLAVNKPVKTSSLEASQFGGANAVDGNLATRWSSAYADPQWIYVDLGATYNVNHVVLKWEAAYALQYRIEVSNDATNWTPVYTESAGNGAIDDISFVSTATRYVRMYSTKRGTQYGNSLWEFEVYGSGS